MIVVADTSPLNYLILIGYVDVLEALYRHVTIPPAVRDELLHPSAPPSVRAWMQTPPHWLEVRTPGHTTLTLSTDLDEGEREAIALACENGAGSTLIIDERAGRREAMRLGLRITGTLAILEEADKRGLLDLRQAIERLRRTTFKVSDVVLKQFLSSQL